MSRNCRKSACVGQWRKGAHVLVERTTVRLGYFILFLLLLNPNHPSKASNAHFTRWVDMKDKKSASKLQRILVTCAAQTALMVP
ncbi:hypothetical protein ACLB2K_063490 [Fragaria x ananassa]